MLSFRCFHSVRARLFGAALAVAAAGLTAASSVAAAQTAEPPPSQRFTIYLRSAPIGSEQVSVERTTSGWTIISSGSTDPPLDLVLRNVAVHYTLDWKPIDLEIDATLRGQLLRGRATVSGSAVHNVFTQGGQSIDRTDAIAPDAVILPSPLWGPFEALSRRLKTVAAGATIPAYTLGSSFPIQVGASTPETLQRGSETIRATRTAMTLMAAGAPLGAELWSDEEGRLLRLSIPAQNLEVVRADIASVAVRRVAISRPNDKEMRIPANGFTLAATVSAPIATTPIATASKRMPAVILVGGSGPSDRDETVYGIPIFGQLAGMLADAGFVVVRYDKRGVGQSGGRPEAATLEDFSEDLLAVVRSVRRMPTVDSKRIAVVGHSEGGTVAMLAAARSDDIDALALVSTIGTTGAELNLWQVTHGLERANRPAAEKEAALDLQKRIQTAVVTGAGWDAIPPQYRRQADIPWFKSFLTFDPAKVMPKVSQPILVVQGLLDTQVPPFHADRLEELARRRKRAAVDVVKIPGVNHLLVAATTGEADEYASLREQTVSTAVGNALVEWLRNTFAPAK